MTTLRVDTTNIARGREFSLYALTNEIKSIELYAFNSATKEYISIDNYEIDSKSPFNIVKAIAPAFNGFLLATINDVPVIKKIGYVYGVVCVSYKSGYDLPYKMYNVNYEVTKTGYMANIVSKFFYTTYDKEDIVLEFNNKQIILQKWDFKMRYDIIQKREGSFEADIGNVSLNDVSLPEITLPQTDIGDVSISATMPEYEIKEL